MDISKEIPPKLAGGYIALLFITMFVLIIAYTTRDFISWEITWSVWVSGIATFLTLMVLWIPLFGLYKQKNIISRVSFILAVIAALLGYSTVYFQIAKMVKYVKSIKPRRISEPESAALRLPSGVYWLRNISLIAFVIFNTIGMITWKK